MDIRIVQFIRWNKLTALKILPGAQSVSSQNISEFIIPTMIIKAWAVFYVNLNHYIMNFHTTTPNPNIACSSIEHNFDKACYEDAKCQLVLF